MKNLSALTTVAPDVVVTLSVVDNLDSCFLVGFARLGETQQAALDALAGIYTGTPLAQPLEAALTALRQSSFLPEHFATLARARSALLGAVHDALVAQAAEVLGREILEVPPLGSSPAEGPLVTWLDSSRHWLSELAISGFARLEVGVLEPFSATLDRLQEEPHLFRLAALLTGFHQELKEQVPVADLEQVPLRRWVDLWSRAVLLAQGLPPELPQSPISGSLEPLGVGLRTHAHVVGLQVYGLLRDGTKTRVLRLGLSAWKVEVVAGLELWKLFRPAHDPVLEALAGPRSLRLEGVPQGGGELRWGGKWTTGAAFDLMSAAACLAPGAAGAPPLEAVGPWDRHPTQISIPVKLEGPFDGSGLSFRYTGEINQSANADVIPTASAVVALLAFDGEGWYLQPLAAEVKGKKSATLYHSGWLAMGHPKNKPKEDPVVILRGFASRLLRKKS